jgi:hypothetical protein
MATHRRATSTRGWAKAAPKQGPQRRKVYSKCGAKAFLLPNTKKHGDSKYPIVPKKGTCEPDCRGIEAAKMRASQQLSRRLSKRERKQMRKLIVRANNMGRRARCRWAR